MKSLYLIRHARAAEKNPGQLDIERPLNAIGLQNSSRMGRNFYEKDVLPDAIYCSPAERARTTASLIAEQINFDPGRIYFMQDIYEAPVRVLLQLVNQFDEKVQEAFIIGHNPGMSYLAEYITGESIGNMTTCGVVKVSIELSSWSEISEKNCQFEFYEYPDLLNF